MSKGLEKELDFLIAAKNNLWAAGMGSFGGSLSLMIFTLPLLIKGIMIGAGFIVSILFFDNYLKKDDRINEIIKVLKKRGD
ncbi:MAG: hypothetical protein A2039_05890 [Candidatus Melainabacteria bacterium GWA2_34_9]|nr:MAG: hypothetical protein A2039_05890 [Candidatus Melainabacteria bacterium GWA2_34_9]